MTLPFTSFAIPLQVVVLGTATGIGIGLFAVGLVLIFRATRVINFAYGVIGSLPATILPVLVLGHRWPYWLALPLSLIAGIGAGCLTEACVVRRLRGAGRLTVMVATVAAAQVIGVGQAFIPVPNAVLRQPYPTPFRVSFSIGSLDLQSSQVLLLTIAPVLALSLALFLRKTAVGLAARASAENPDAAQALGVPTHSVSLTIWGIGGLFAATSAILVGATHAVAVGGPAVGSDLFVEGLAAAIVGGMASLPQAFSTGIFIGVTQALLAWNFPTANRFSLILFAAILVSLLIRRGLGQAVRGSGEGSWNLAAAVRVLPPHLASARRVVAARRAASVCLVVAAALLALALDNSHRVLLSTIIIFIIMCLSVVILTGFAGQVSLGQMGFVALGAYAGGRMHQLGFPVAGAIAYAVVLPGLAALVIGVPALRVQGLFLAAVTASFAAAAHGWLFQQSWLVNDNGSGSQIIPRPASPWDLRSELDYTILCLALLVLVGAVVQRLRRSGIGRMMLAVRDNDAAAASMGISPPRIKLLAFVLAGMIAGLAGYLYGGLLENFTGTDISSPDLSLILVVAVALGGSSSVTGAVLGGLWIKGIPYALGSNVGLLASGLGVLLILLLFPDGLAGIVFRVRDAVIARLTGEHPATDDPGAPPVGQRTVRLPSGPSLPERADPPTLTAENICVRYGGITAVRRVSINVNPGEILGLMGPNGAGKTTLFDVLSGHLRPSSGRIVLDGTDVTECGPVELSRLGMARTFQQARLFDQLTLMETFQVALERRAGTELVPTLLGLPPARSAEYDKALRAGELIELLGLRSFAFRRIAELSTGVRRLAELGCVIASEARIILLDEPTAGIAQAEVEQFGRVIGDVRRHLGATMVLIEHDLPLMMSLVDRIYVMSAGELIAEGAPDLVRRDAAVVAAYLGHDERVIDRSGAPRQLAPTARKALSSASSSNTRSDT